jgi:hypothetical protein
MADEDTPAVVHDFNQRIVSMLKELNSADFVTVVSNSARLVHLAADQQQQQQQQQAKRF